jgi:hypothetical protein
MISIVLKELKMGGHETISRVQMIGIVSEDYSVEHLPTPHSKW